MTTKPPLSTAPARVRPGASAQPVVPVHTALAANQALTTLRARLQASNARFEAIRPALPGALQSHVKPGPVDEQGWSLLVANGAVAAKLRQLVPRLEAALEAGGFPALPMRIKVQAGGGSQ